ncbi:phage holin family protein [Deinococcus aquatilis]|uniref:phage holin family protein n=1 Tax=Deinococcus aquatilis TaxID=519440 RepID=UPI00036BF642|nr:phage holin family protein [Deinococcus aquatilis]
MEERKSMGGAIVDVFDAAVTLVKSEINGVARRVGDVAKAKGIGVVLLLASSGPLILGLVFLILAVYFGLVRLGLGWWSAALLIALFSFALTGALVFLGIKRLGAEVKTDDTTTRRSGPMTEDEMLEARYQAEQKALKDGQKQAQGAGGYKVADTGSKPATSTPGGQSIHTPSAVQTHSTPKTEAGRGNTTGGIDMTRDPDLHTAGETRVVAESAGHATVRVEGGTTTVPVFESKSDGEAQVYGSGLNKKIDGSDNHESSSGHGNADHSSHGSHGHGGHAHDPNLQNPVVLKDAPGITVSTNPTFRDDMQEKEN